MRLDGRTVRCRPVAGSRPSDYDLNGSGVINAAQWAQDPRVQDANGNGVIDPEDLIAAFSCFDARSGALGTPSWPGGRLHCSNGAATRGVSTSASAITATPDDPYPHDISGWDFYDDQNDPATVDAAYAHSDDQMALIHHICPRCLILPVKAGD